MTTIQVRIDERTKKESKKILDELGLDMSTAIKAYLAQITRIKGIPFPLLTENGMTPEEEREILLASEEARRGINVVRTRNMKEMQALLDQWKNPHVD